MQDIENMVAAARSGDTETVVRRMRQGVNPYVSNAGGDTAFRVALLIEAALDAKRI